jgi:hypothetical protein
LKIPAHSTGLDLGFAIRRGRTTVNRVHGDVDQPGFGFGVGPKTCKSMGWGGVALLRVWRCVAGRGLTEVRRLAGGVLILLCILELSFSNTRGNIHSVPIFSLHDSCFGCF